MSIIYGNSRSKDAIDRRAERVGRFYPRKTAPTRDDLRTMLAEAARNTQASADSATSVRLTKQGRRT